MALIGYARVSKVDQDPQLQLDALDAAGCDDTYIDKASGLREDRPEFLACMRNLRQGDTLVVWKLDRLGRSTPHLLSITEELRQRGVHFRTLTEAIDTSTPAGRLMFTMMAAIATFERDLIVERTRAGMAAARGKGIRPGPRTVMNPEKIKAAQKMLKDGQPATTVCQAIGVSRATLYRHLPSADAITASDSWTHE